MKSFLLCKHVELFSRAITRRVAWLVQVAVCSCQGASGLGQYRPMESSPIPGLPPLRAKRVIKLYPYLSTSEFFWLAPLLPFGYYVIFQHSNSLKYFWRRSLGQGQKRMVFLGKFTYSNTILILAHMLIKNCLYQHKNMPGYLRVFSTQVYPRLLYQLTPLARFKNRPLPVQQIGDNFS